MSSDHNVVSSATKINDFVLSFATVNGTGSASANTMIARAILRMGVPIVAKNLFPSNIQGLPTWYEIRVSEEGNKARRSGIDLMVALNPQSFDRDMATVLAGGVFVYDSTKPIAQDRMRRDVKVIGIPMMQLCMQNFEDPRQRLLFKNVLYVGALAQLLNIDLDVTRGVIHDEFSAKPKLVDPNLRAMELGVQYVEDNVQQALPIRVERRDLVGDRIFISGNDACGLGAVYAGATVAAWYPITPSTSLVSAFEKFANQLRVDPQTGEKNFAVIQAEDEISAVGMVLGAMWNGSRAFTATSGPGISLMGEFLGFSYFAEIPAVLVDVQRVGPSTGMPTRTQQSDLLLCAYASHGDTKHVLLFPGDPSEAFHMMATAFDLAEGLQTAIIVMSDLDIGMNDHLCDPLTAEETPVLNRGKVLSVEQLEQMKSFGRYLDVDNDGIGYRTIPALHPTLGSYFTRGSSHDEYARYTEDSAAYVRSMERLSRKWETAKSMVPAPVFYQEQFNSTIGVVFYGSSTAAALEAQARCAREGLTLDAMRVRSFPFSDTVIDFINQHEYVLIIEQNRDAQLRTLLLSESDVNPRSLLKVLHFDGMPLTARHVYDGIKLALAAVGIEVHA